MTRNKQKKSPLRSRTVWVGLISVAIAIVLLLSDQPFIDDKGQQVLLFVSGVLTICFRQLSSVQTLPFKELLKK